MKKIILTIYLCFIFFNKTYAGIIIEENYIETGFTPVIIDRYLDIILLLLIIVYIILLLFYKRKKSKKW